MALPASRRNCGGRPPHTQGPEPEPVKWLRRYSNYLTPKLGLMSVDTWTLLGTYLRNLTLNWLVLVPLLATVLLAPRLLVSILHWKVGGSHAILRRPCSSWGFSLVSSHYPPAHVPAQPRSTALKPRLWKRFERQQWFLIGGLTPLMAAALLLDHRLCLVSQWRRPARPTHAVRPG